MDYATLLSSLKRTFINQDDFMFDKHTPDFQQDGKFLGDYFSQLAVEPRGTRAPRFYHTFSPFDVISNKAPHRAVVFDDGELILDIDFDSYVAMRSAAMNAVVLQGLGIDSLADKHVLLFGGGHLATQALKILASQLGLTAVDVITKSGDLTRIKKATEDIDLEISSGSIEDIAKYDVIICHTQAAASIITSEHIDKVKQGAVITTFITSTEHGEVADAAFDSKNANIITDWDKTILGAKEMQRAQDLGLFKPQDIVSVKELLQDPVRIDKDKHYTIYRSTGTPIQNLAVLRELVAKD